MGYLKILVITPTFPPQVNGLANVAFKYCEGLARYGHSVDVVSSGRSSYEHAGFPVRTFDVKGNFSLRNIIHGEILNYVRFLKTQSYDLIICHAMQTGVVDLAFLFAKAPILYFSHGVSWRSAIMPGRFYGISRKISYLPYRLLGPLIIKRAKYGVFLGRSTINDRTFDSLFIARENKITIPNASDFPWLEPKDFRKIKRLKLLTVGACSPEKGFDRLLELLPKLSPRAVQSITICTFDSGRYFLWFKAEMQKLKCDIEVELVINKSAESLLPYYCRSDILLNLSHSECYPLVAADAENCRLPIICYDTGYQSEMSSARTVGNVDEAARLLNSFPETAGLFSDLSQSSRPRTWTESCETLNTFIADKFLAADRLR